MPPNIDKGISQSPTVEKGTIRVKIGSPVYTVDGFNVIIDCNVISGHLPVTIFWFYNQQYDQSRENMSTLTVTDAKDGDNITCKAENSIGFDVQFTQINIVYKKFCIAK